MKAKAKASGEPMRAPRVPRMFACSPPFVNSSPGWKESTHAEMAAFALRWCLDQEGVTTVIPGATSSAQARANAAVSHMTPVSAETRMALWDFYRADVAPHIRGGV